MSRYEKPMVKVNEEVAEGVYAASGDSGVTGNLIHFQSYEENGQWVHKYKLEVSTEKEVNGADVQFDFGQSVGNVKTEGNYDGRHLNAGDQNQSWGDVVVTTNSSTPPTGNATINPY